LYLDRDDSHRCLPGYPISLPTFEGKIDRRGLCQFACLGLCPQSIWNKSWKRKDLHCARYRLRRASKSTRSFWMEAQKDRVRDATDQIIDGLGTMTISGSTMESFVSPISADSRNFAEGYNLNIGDHDPIPIGKQNMKDGRSVKRRCVICGMDTRSQCSHGFCRSRPKEDKGKIYYGTWVCDQKVGKRNNAQVQRKYPGNDLTCLQLHRREFKDQKIPEYRDRMS
jgi:hypothetical protein